MSRFVSASISRIDLGDGDWVEIKTRLRFGDRRAIEEKLLRPSVAADGTITKEFELHMREGNMEVLLRSVTAWGGPGFCAKPQHPHDGECEARPITAENLDALDETGERILAEIQRSQVTRTEAPAPGFTSARSSPSAAEAPTDSSPAVSASSASSSSPDGPGTSS